MAETVFVRRLTAGTIFRLVGTGLCVSLLPLSLIAGVLGYLGLATVTWFGRPIDGIAALGAAPVAAMVYAGIATGVFGALISGGLWLYSRVRPLKISYLSATGFGRRPAAGGAQPGGKDRPSREGESPGR